MAITVIRYTEENYIRLVAPENVIITNGAKQSLFNILYSILNPQDEVIVIAPYWVSYTEMIKMCLGIPVVVTPEDGTFTPRIAEIERAVTSSTRAIIVNSPNNPSGAIYPPELIEKIVDLSERKGIFMICDDIYHKLTFDRNIAVPAYDFTKKDVENSHIVVVNGVAKLYGMTGFRVGWVVGPRQLVQIRRARKARSWNQLTLARKAGIDRGVVFRAENMHPIEATNLRLLADVLELDANDLLGHAEVPPASRPAAKASATRTALMALLDFLDDSQQEALLQHLRYEWRPTTVARPSVVVSRR